MSSRGIDIIVQLEASVTQCRALDRSELLRAAAAEIRQLREVIAGLRAELELWQTTRYNMADIDIDGLRLVCTCSACPEQYDVFDKNNDQVGYLRLRHGYFRADVPDCGGETVYESETKGDGIFDDDERLFELTKAVKAIKKHIKKNKRA